MVNKFVIPHRLKLSVDYIKNEKITTIYIGKTFSSLIERFTTRNQALRFEIQSIEMKLLSKYNEYLFSNFQKESLKGEEPAFYFLGEVNNEKEVLYSIYEHIRRADISDQLLALLDKYYEEDNLNELIKLKVENLTHFLTIDSSSSKKLITAILIKKFVQSSLKIGNRDRKLFKNDGIEDANYIEFWNNICDKKFYYTILHNKVEAISDHFYVGGKDKKTPASYVISATANREEGQWYINVGTNLRTWAITLYDKRKVLAYNGEHRSLLFKSGDNKLNYSVVTLKNKTNTFIPKSPAIEHYLKTNYGSLLEDWHNNPTNFIQNKGKQLKLVLQKDERDNFKSIKAGLSLIDRYWLFQLFCESLKDVVSYPIKEYIYSESPELTKYKTDCWDYNDYKSVIEVKIGLPDNLNIELDVIIREMFKEAEIINDKSNRESVFKIELKNPNTILNLKFISTNIFDTIVTDMVDKKERENEIRLKLKDINLDAALIQIEDYRTSAYKRRLDPKQTIRTQFSKKGIITQFFSPGSINIDKGKSMIRDLLARIGLRNNMQSIVSENIVKDCNVYVSIKKHWNNQKTVYKVIASRLKGGVIQYYIPGMSDFREYDGVLKEIGDFVYYDEQEFKEFAKEIEGKQSGYIVWPTEYKKYINGRNVVYYGQSLNIRMSIIVKKHPSKGTARVIHNNKVLYQPKKMPNNLKVKNVSKENDNIQFENKLPIEFSFYGNEYIDLELSDYLYKLIYLNPTTNSEATVLMMPVHFHKYIWEIY